MVEPGDANVLDRSQLAPRALPGSRAAEHPMIGRVASLVIDVVARLDGPARDPLAAAAECNAVIESCLEADRATDREASLATARDELRRLARLLTQVDLADVPLVLRQIRRVLGRFDALGV